VLLSVLGVAGPLVGGFLLELASLILLGCIGGALLRT
jgi:hypothetical protein